MNSQPSNTTATLLRVLCLGDVVGQPGRYALHTRLSALRKSWQIDMVIANGENAAGGIGLTRATAEELFSSGVDVVTSGNHIWKHADIVGYIEKNDRVLRPANYPAGAPGRGIVVVTLPSGTQVAVLNMLGRVFLENVDCPFHSASQLLDMLDHSVKIRIVDFHAEATSEKRAFAHFFDGRVSAVFGTHTHVQTADAFISASGTASITDIGMCGVEADSVIGMQAQAVLERFVTARPARFIPAKGNASLNGIVLDIDTETGKTVAIRLVRDNAPVFTEIGLH